MAKSHGAKARSLAVRPFREGIRPVNTKRPRFSIAKTGKPTNDGSSLALCAREEVRYCSATGHRNANEPTDTPDPKAGIHDAKQVIVLAWPGI